MSDVRRHFPANRLASALAGARPASAEQALRRADENLQGMAGVCLELVERSIRLIEAAANAYPPGHDAGYLASLYRIVVSIVGAATTAGLPALDQAAASLADVLDGMMIRRTWDGAAVDVHIKSMRLLKDPSMQGENAELLLGQLARVRKLHSPDAGPALPG